jgi:hypothetical protein
MSITTGLFAPGLDPAEKLLTLLEAAENPTVNTLTVVSGTAQQDETGLPSTITVAVTGGGSGTLEVQIGPTNTVAKTLVTAEGETANGLTTFPLPAGWFFKLTVGGSAALGTVTQIVGA